MKEDQRAPSSPRNERAWHIVWTLAWPAVALNTLQVVNNLLDNFFVGHLSSSALAAYGAVTSVMFMMFSLSMAMGTAATALVSRAYGAGDVEEYRASARQSVVWALLIGMCLMVVGELVAPFTARILLPATDPAAIPIMTNYQRIYSLAIPAFFIIQSLAGCLRGVGDTRSPMWISGIQILLHMVFNFLLIFPSQGVMPGAGMGLLGAAAALTISAWLSAVLYLFFSKQTKLGSITIAAKPLKDWGTRIFRIAVPAAVMAVLRVSSLAVFTIILKYTPEASPAIASMRTGFALESIMFMPAFGLSVAATALVGQSLGMKDPERANRLAWTASHHAAVVTACLAIPIYLAAPYIAGHLIQNNPDVVRHAILLIQYLCVTEVFFAYGMVLTGAMQGAGDTKSPLWISIIGLWFLRVPLTALLAVGPPTLAFGLAMGAGGAWLSMALTQAVQGFMCMVLFKRGHWRTARV